MGNINAPSLEYFESFAAEIAGKFNRLKKLVTHSTSSGDYHEEVLRAVLRNFLPKRFSVKKGFMYGGEERLSKQVDILVIDENVPAAYIFQEGDFAVVLPQAVVAAIEVKSVLNAAEFDAALENIESAKALMQYPSRLAGIVFGFDGTEPAPGILRDWFMRERVSAFKNKVQLAPDAIMFFNSAVLLVRCDDQAMPSHDGKFYHRIGTDNEGELNGAAFQLSVLLAMIVNSCERQNMVVSGMISPGNAFQRLVQIERGGVGVRRYSFGEEPSTYVK